MSGGKFCIWSEPDFTGQFKESALPLGTCAAPIAAWPDGTSSRIRSLVNRTRFQLEASETESCTEGLYHVLKPGGGAKSVTDRLTTLRLAPDCDLNNVCVYENKDATGTRWQFRPATVNECYEGGSDVSGYAFYNNTAHSATFHHSYICTIRPTALVAKRSFGAFSEKIGPVFKLE
ncbi:peptidase inhibitor family I36 protein [Streptomyces sp. NPDC020141]|uniref:peptidase inhibitor family I36 protein n=1 Tax=Streptomyces sp. NPDC020141 TaxID=3365065 RepID=UPI0037892FD8